MGVRWLRLEPKPRELLVQGRLGLGAAPVAALVVAHGFGKPKEGSCRE